jgi:hypothetical protein
VLVGLLSWFAVLYVTVDLVPNAYAETVTPFGTSDMVITGARWILGALAAGAITSVVAGRSPRKCAFVVGVFCVLYVWFLVGWGSLDFFSPTFIHSASALMVVASMVGSAAVDHLRGQRTKARA